MYIHFKKNSISITEPEPRIAEDFRDTVPFCFFLENIYHDVIFVDDFRQVVSVSTDTFTLTRVLFIRPKQRVDTGRFLLPFTPPFVFCQVVSHHTLALIITSPSPLASLYRLPEVRCSVNGHLANVPFLAPFIIE